MKTLLIVTATLSGACLFFSVAQPHEIKTVHNGSTGLWAGDSTKRVTLEPEVTIGVHEGSSEFVFGRIADIVVDSRMNILVLDNGYSRVQMYDSAGAHIGSAGRAGEGPGEFSFPTAIAIDKSDNVYVASRGKICVFDSNLGYVDEFRHRYPDGITRSMRVNEESSIFFTSLDILEQKVVHKYSGAHEYLFSFSDSYAVGQDIDVRVEGTYGGRLRMGAFAGSASIIILPNGNFINVIHAPESAEENASTIFDLFDRAGNLLMSHRFHRLMKAKRCDRRGRLYVVDTQEFPQIGRYRFDLGE